MQKQSNTEREVREKFWNAARSAYPDVGEPGTVWVLTEVLGWPWAKVQTIAVEGFSRDGYRTFLFDTYGKRILADDGMSVKTVYRKWTKQEKSLLKDWWWLLNF